MSANLLQINVGKQIQKLRELKCISQQDLAAKCNFEKSNMSRLEAGRVNPTLSTLEKVFWFPNTLNQIDANQILLQYRISLIYFLPLWNVLICAIAKFIWQM